MPEGPIDKGYCQGKVNTVKPLEDCGGGAYYIGIIIGVCVAIVDGKAVTIIQDYTWTCQSCPQGQKSPTKINVNATDKLQNEKWIP